MGGLFVTHDDVWIGMLMLRYCSAAGRVQLTTPVDPPAGKPASEPAMTSPSSSRLSPGPVVVDARLKREVGGVAVKTLSASLMSAAMTCRTVVSAGTVTIGAVGVELVPRVDISPQIGSVGWAPEYRRIAPAAWRSVPPHENVTGPSEAEVATLYQVLSWQRMPRPGSLSQVPWPKPAWIGVHPVGVTVLGLTATPRTAISRSPLLPDGTSTCSEATLVMVLAVSTPTNDGGAARATGAGSATRSPATNDGTAISLRIASSSGPTTCAERRSYRARSVHCREC